MKPDDYIEGCLSVLKDIPRDNYGGWLMVCGIINTIRETQEKRGKDWQHLISKNDLFHYWQWFYDLL